HTEQCFCQTTGFCFKCRWIHPRQRPEKQNPVVWQKHCSVCPVYFLSLLWNFGLSLPEQADCPYLHKFPGVSRSWEDNNPSFFSDPAQSPDVPGLSQKSCP